MVKIMRDFFSKNKYVILLCVLPFLIYLPFFTGFLKGDPLNAYANISYNIHFFKKHDLSTIDPNIAYTTQALGKQALYQIVHGHVPWWNHYEGLGTPLAGEAQSAALFPFLLLMLLPSGFFVFQAVLQVVAGLSTYNLLRTLKCSSQVSFVSAVLFEFNGTFSWLRNAVFNPVAFLPMILLGIEIAYISYERGDKSGRGGDWIALGIALSLYAGFPETAYLDGLLCLGWSVVRFFSLKRNARLGFSGYIFFSGFIALALSAPFLVSLFDFWKDASLGEVHDGGQIADFIPGKYLVSLFIPYATGSIFRRWLFGDFWGIAGGYLGITPFILACLGLFGRSYRALKIFLSSWSFIFLGASYGIPYGMKVMAFIVPLGGKIFLCRYIAPSCEMSVIILAAFGLENIRNKFKFPRKHIFALFSVFFTLFLYSLFSIVSSKDYSRSSISFFSIGFFVCIVGIFVRVFIQAREEKRPNRLRYLAIFEMLVLFSIPLLGNIKKVSLDMGGISYLQQHIGYNRFLTFGPIAPNYGSFYNISSINDIDVPVPQRWATYIKKHLDSRADPILFIGEPHIEPFLQDSFVDHSDEFRKIGVKYIILPPDEVLKDDIYKTIRKFIAESKDVHLVYDGKAMRIYDIGSYAPYITAPGCDIDIQSHDRIYTKCNKDSIMIRRELFMKGWQARVNNISVDVQEEGIFQKVNLKEGDNKLSFKFVPPFMNYAFICLLLGVMGLLLMIYKGYSGKAFPWMGIRKG